MVGEISPARPGVREGCRAPGSCGRSALVPCSVPVYVVPDLCPTGPKVCTVSHSVGHHSRFPAQTVHRVPDFGTRCALSPPNRSPCPRLWDAVRAFPAQPFTVSPTLGRGARFSRPTVHRVPDLGTRCALFPPAVALYRHSQPVAPIAFTPPHRHRSNFTLTTCNTEMATQAPPPRTPPPSPTSSAPPRAWLSTSSLQTSTGAHATPKKLLLGQ